MDKKYWYGIEIAEIKKVYGYGFEFYKETNESRGYFKIEMKSGVVNTMQFITQSRSHSYVKDKRRELMKLYNKYNSVPEMYLLENTIFINVNGRCEKFGCRCQDNCGDSVYLTNKEIEQLNRQFKIRDEGWRHLAYIEEFSINGNKVNRPIEQRHLDQLKYMGYDISLLEYELKES